MRKLGLSKVNNLLTVTQFVKGRAWFPAETFLMPKVIFYSNPPPCWWRGTVFLSLSSFCQVWDPCVLQKWWRLLSTTMNGTLLSLSTTCPTVFDGPLRTMVSQRLWTSTTGEKCRAMCHNPIKHHLSVFIDREKLGEITTFPSIELISVQSGLIRPHILHILSYLALLEGLRIKTYIFNRQTEIYNSNSSSEWFYFPPTLIMKIVKHTEKSKNSIMNTHKLSSKILH